MCNAGALYRKISPNATETLASYLYIFPHPDDESFGPALGMARQRRQGHAVSLLTLTKGEATTQRERLGYSREKMAQVRYGEMQDVAEVLDLADLSVTDFPDGGLDDLDPRRLEDVVAEHIQEVNPDVVVTYAVHGISGHPDHLVTHAVVKRVWCALQEQDEEAPKRLAFFTLREDGQTDRPDHLKGSADALIDCVVPFEEADRQKARAALDCYATYQQVITRHQPLKRMTEGVCFELFQENHTPPLDDLLDRLPEQSGALS